MEDVKRKCASCNKIMELDKYNGDRKTCVICLEKARERYIENKENILSCCKKYREANVDKEKERHRIYNLQNNEIIKEKKRLYRNIEYYCPVCLCNVKLYRKNDHCKSLLHMGNWSVLLMKIKNIYNLSYKRID